MSGLEVRGQKIPTPAKENSTAFQLGTDDTKGYTGGSDIVLMKFRYFNKHADGSFRYRHKENKINNGYTSSIQTLVSKIAEVDFRNIACRLG